MLARQRKKVITWKIGNLLSKKLEAKGSKTSKQFKTMVHFRTISTSIAAASTVSAFSMLRTEAFAPSPTISNLVAQNHHAYYSSLQTKLSASVVDEVDMKGDDSPIPKDEPKIVATADIHSFIPSPNGKAGIMAIKVREEDLDVNTVVSVAATIDVDKKSSETGMFGGIASQAQSAVKKKSQNNLQGEDFIGKAVVFPNGERGTVIAQRPPMAFIMCDFASVENQDAKVSILGTRSFIPVSEKLFGSVIDCYGNPLEPDSEVDGNSDVFDRAIFAPIPKVSDIALINKPLLTGTAMVDALAPIGKGQNMLIVGQDTGVGQRDLVIGAIKTQLKQKDGAKCIYAITSNCDKEREEVLSKMKEAGILDDIVVVSARNTHGSDIDEKKCPTDSAEAITVAAAACSIGEGLALAKGIDSFVVVDNIDQHKTFWDWTTRILIDIYGVDAVVKDDRDGGASSEMRGFYSSLIQRAVQFNKKNGGGSMTLTLLTNLEGQFGGADDESTVFSPDDFAESSEKVKQRIAILEKKNIPLTPETLRKIQIPLPVASDSEKQRRIALQHTDDLISMSDGQIWLDEKLYNQGQRPALDAQRSITRVGIGADTVSRADAPAMRGLAGGLRFDFAQADSLDGAGANSGADKQILKKKAYLLAMHQEAGDERTLSENAVALLAASLRVLDETIQNGGEAGTELGQNTMRSLLEHVNNAAPDALSEIDNSLDLSESVRTELEKVIKEHFA